MIKMDVLKKLIFGLENGVKICSEHILVWLDSWFSLGDLHKPGGHNFRVFISISWPYFDDFVIIYDHFMTIFDHLLTICWQFFEHSISIPWPYSNHSILDHFMTTKPSCHPHGSFLSPLFSHRLRRTFFSWQ